MPVGCRELIKDRQSLKWCGEEAGNKRMRAMKKPVPEQFGLTKQEYAHLVVERTRLSNGLIFFS